MEIRLLIKSLLQQLLVSHVSSFKKFEDIIAWQKGRLLTHRVYQITSNPPFKKDFSLKDQIRRASLSIMANIAEGFGRGSNREFAYFLAIAKGSAAEVKSLLYVALDAEYIRQIDHNILYDLSTEIEALTGGLIHHLKTTPYKGSRHLTSKE